MYAYARCQWLKASTTAGPGLQCCFTDETWWGVQPEDSAECLAVVGNGRLLRRPSAIDCDRLRGDVAGGIAHQVLGEDRDFLDGDEGLLGHRLQHDLLD